MMKTSDQIDARNVLPATFAGLLSRRQCLARIPDSQLFWDAGMTAEALTEPEPRGGGGGGGSGRPAETSLHLSAPDLD